VSEMLRARARASELPLLRRGEAVHAEVSGQRGVASRGLYGPRRHAALGDGPIHVRSSSCIASPDAAPKPQRTKRSKLEAQA
jgi:hypothetical protein